MTTYSATTGASVYVGRFAASALPATLTVASPQFWAQCSRPQVVRSGDLVFFGHTNMSGDSLISSYNITTGATSSFTLATGSGPNGHDSSVIGIRPDGRIIAAWSTHNNQSLRRISTNPLDISSFGSALVLSGVTPVSYCNLIYLSTPNRWYVHARQGNGGGPGDRVCIAWASTDNMDSVAVGESWLVQAGERPYVISCNNGTNRVDFFVTNRHQTDSGPDSFFNLYHCYAIFAADGSKVFYASDGTSIGSSVTRISTQCTLIHTGATNGPAWNWDIAYGSDGHPRVLYVRQVADDDHRHMFARWTGSAWTATEIGASGQRLYSTEIWSDGALSFDGLGVDCIVRGVWVGSAVEGQDWRTSNNGATWTKFSDLTSGSSAGQKFVTPLKVTNADTRVSRAWKRGTISDWTNFALSIYLMGKP